MSRGGAPSRRNGGGGNPDYRLPGEILDAAGVPNQHRYQVAYLTLCAKYCAFVEAVMELTGGEPVRVSLKRAREIVGYDEDTDPRLIPMVAEDPAGNGEHVLVRIASVEEIDLANKRSLLHKMGPSRN